MEDIIKNNFCNLCENNKCKKCMKIKWLRKNGITIYKCVNYKYIKRKGEKQKMKETNLKKYLIYSFYEDNGKYTAIIKKDTPKEIIKEFKRIYEDVQYEEFWQLKGEK